MGGVNFLAELKLIEYFVEVNHIVVDVRHMIQVEILGSISRPQSREALIVNVGRNGSISFLGKSSLDSLEDNWRVIWKF